MLKKNLMGGLQVLAVAALAFGAGMQFQKIRYDDICLDMGGGSNPGNHPICVMERSDGGFWIGPVRITPASVIAIDRSDASSSTSQISIKLNEPAAQALREYTERHVGQDLEVRVDGGVIRRVRIAEAIGAAFTLPDLSPEDATTILRMLSPQT